MARHVKNLHALARRQKYTVVRKIGKGTMGVIYEYVHAPTQKSVAIKWVVLDPYYEEDVLNEIGLGRLFYARDGQTNLISVSAFIHGEIAHESYRHDVYGLIQAVYAGDLVSGFLREPRTFAELKCVVRGVLNGISVLHQRRYAHNDVKPENILIGKKGTPFVSDFGGLTRDGDTLGIYTQGQTVVPENEPRDGKAGKGAFENDLYGLLFTMGTMLEQNPTCSKFRALLRGVPPCVWVPQSNAAHIQKECQAQPQVNPGSVDCVAGRHRGHEMHPRTTVMVCQINDVGESA